MELQRALEQQGFDPNGVDGIFGENTNDALDNYLREMQVDPAAIRGGDLSALPNGAVKDALGRLTTLQDADCNPVLKSLYVPKDNFKAPQAGAGRSFCDPVSDQKGGCDVATSDEIGRFRAADLSRSM